MALFAGEDLIDVASPDGRVLKLPRSLVPQTMLPQQIGAPAPFTDEIAGAAPSVEIPSLTGGAAPVLDASGAIAPQIPTPSPQPSRAELQLPPVDTAAIEKRQAAQARQQAAQARAQAQYTASPAGQMDAANGGQQDAYAQEAAAVKEAAIADAAGQVAQAEAKEAWNTKIDQAIGDRAIALADQAQREQAKYAEVESLSKKIANTKIDRSADHPIIAAVGIALAGLGSAMKGESTNPALEVYWKAIDRKVAAQMADLDQMAKVYGMTKDELVSLKDAGQSRLALHNTLIAAELDKSNRHLDALATRTSSDKTKANIPVLQAQIAQRSAAARTAAVQAKLEYEQKERQHAEAQKTQRYGIAVQDRHAKEQEKIQRDGMVLDWDKAQLQAGAVAGDAQAKARLKRIDDNQTRGLKDLKSNTPLYTAAGVAKMRQAEKLEASAAKLDPWDTATPQKAAQLRQDAAQLRDEAGTYDIALARDTTNANKVMAGYAATRSVLGTINRINQLVKDNGRVWVSKGEGQAAIDTLYSELAAEIKDALQLGAWDKGSAALVENIVGRSPTGEWDTSAVYNAIKRRYGQGDGNALRKLDEFGTQLKMRTASEVMASSQNLDRGMNPDDLFEQPRRPVESTDEAQASAAFRQQTPLEREQEIRNRGAVSSAIHTTGRLIESGARGLVGVGIERAGTNDDVADKAANSGGKYPGLSKDQAAWADRLITKSLGSPSSADPAGDQLVQEVLNAAYDRPGFANALAQTVQNNAPHVYNRLRPLVPVGSPLDDYLAATERAALGAAQAEPAPLAAVAVTDDVAYKALAAKATTPGPQQEEARKLLEPVIIERARRRAEGAR